MEGVNVLVGVFVFVGVNVCVGVRVIVAVLVGGDVRVAVRVLVGVGAVRVYVSTRGQVSVPYFNDNVHHEGATNTTAVRGVIHINVVIAKSIQIDGAAARPGHRGGGCSSHCHCRSWLN